MKQSYTQGSTRQGVKSNKSENVDRISVTGTFYALN